MLISPLRRVMLSCCAPFTLCVREGIATCGLPFCKDMRVNGTVFHDDRSLHCSDSMLIHHIA